MNIHSRMHDFERYTLEYRLHCTHAPLISMGGRWHKAGVSGFLISSSTYFVLSPKPCNGNVKTSVHEDRLKNLNLLQ
jgi:hypothetical protein